MSTTRSTRSGSNRVVRDDGGIGLIGTISGVVAFLALLLLAVQVTYDLYATSAVTSAAFDAVRIVAGADATDQRAAQADAEAGARRVLGRYGERVSFTWSVDDDVVTLRVRATNPGFLPAALRRPLAVDAVDRTVRAQVERFR
ncbi:MAG TPA: hypothetical protein VFB78_05760 [Acidimicrobiales bacterium]|nr:hypothetical protein [Acidimicrobiales bacterium]